MDEKKALKRLQELQTELPKKVPEECKTELAELQYLLKDAIREIQNEEYEDAQMTLEQFMFTFLPEWDENVDSDMGDIVDWLGLEVDD